MKLQFVAVKETGASELLPLDPETVRVFLILRGARADGTTRPSTNPSPPPSPGQRSAILAHAANPPRDDAARETF